MRRRRISEYLLERTEEAFYTARLGPQEHVSVPCPECPWVHFCRSVRECCPREKQGLYAGRSGKRFR